VDHVAEVAQLPGLDGLLDVPDVNIGNDLCLLPWFWPGPFNVLTEGQTGSYSACNGSGSSSAEGINILNNACILPWMWQGPINFLVGGMESDYEACNSYGGEDVFANGIAQYMTIQYMIDQNMLDEGAFEAFLSGDITAHEVVLDKSLLPQVDEETGSNIGNNACILPWLWQGPLNFLTNGQTADYAACND
jgi:hypothetical protein